MPGIIRTIDKDGFLWIADGQKFIRVHMVSGERRIVLTEPSLAPFLDNVQDHCMDPGGVIWIPTSGFGVL